MALYRFQLGELHRKLVGFIIMITFPPFSEYRVLFDDCPIKGLFSQAEAEYQQVERVLRNTLGKRHIEMAEVYNSRGLILKKQQNYKLAGELYEQAIDIVIATFGTHLHYKCGLFKNNLGDILRKTGDLDGALSMYIEAKDILAHTLGEQHSEVAEAIFNIARVHVKVKNYEEALMLFDRALATVQRIFGPLHYKSGLILNCRGGVVAKLGDYRRACCELEEALRVLRLTLGTDHVEVRYFHCPR